jgi:transposase-like protein
MFAEALRGVGCPHEDTIKCGYTRNRNPRRRCKACGTLFTLRLEDKWPLEYSWLPKARIVALVKCYRAGNTARHATRVLGLASNTVRTAYRKLRERLGPVKCACGQEAGHRGWCKVRFQKSPKRQAFMKRWDPPKGA